MKWKSSGDARIDDDANPRNIADPAVKRNWSGVRFLTSHRERVVMRNLSESVFHKGIPHPSVEQDRNLKMQGSACNHCEKFSTEFLLFVGICSYPLIADCESSDSASSSFRMVRPSQLERLVGFIVHVKWWLLFSTQHEATSIDIKVDKRTEGYQFGPAY